MNDTSLADDQTASDEGSVFSIPDPGENTDQAKSIVDRVLDLEHVMSSARLVERIVRLNLRGDLEAEYADLQEELAELVDVDGKLLSEDGDSSLADAGRANEVNARMGVLQRQMRAESFIVRFRAMPEDKFETFEATHRGKDGAAKNKNDYFNRLISECAIAPALTAEEVKRLRTKLNHSQVDALVKGAYSANTTGGLDVPKLPSFWRSPQQQESSQS